MNNYRHNLTQSSRHFSGTVSADIKRSTFERNSSLKTTFNAGELVPVYVDEVLPGDTFELNMAFISRLVTPIFPTMDRLDLDFYAFFTPNRLCWTGWEELCGENKNSAWIPQNPPALVPKATYSNTEVVERSIMDYFGLPLGVDIDNYDISALPFRAYCLIWNEWFRDQNLQSPFDVKLTNSNGVTFSSVSNFNFLQGRPFKANKKHDYFTSCLPSPQKGQSQLIPISLNQLIPVITGNRNPNIPADAKSQLLSWAVVDNNNEHIPFTQNARLINSNSNNVVGTKAGQTPTGEGTVRLYPDNLYSDFRGVTFTSSTISELRTAFQIQKLFEKDARGGTRYREILLSHFGVSVEDYRVQVPEFLGHFHERVGMSQVAQTSATSDTSPQGNLSAFSYTQGAGNLFKKSFVEHGYVHILCVARSPKTYQNGIEKMWRRRERFDFYYPTLAHISEQPVYVEEIFVDPTFIDHDAVFGYQEAWADYRYKLNKVTGQFRSGITTSLDNWHYADFYKNRPFLSAGWIEDNTETNLSRTLALDSSTSDQIYLDIAFMNKATRPMPVYSIPGLVDHF